jgi:hypothetical protein
VTLWANSDFLQRRKADTMSSLAHCKAQAVLSEAALLSATFGVGYFPPNTS